MHIQCICTHKLQLELMVLHCIDSHIVHHQKDSLDLSLTAYGGYRCMWWFLMFCSNQSLQDNEGFILPMNFTASADSRERLESLLFQVLLQIQALFLAYLPETFLF